MIDTNVYLSRWPTRRLPCDETAALVTKLKAAGVSHAWAGSFDALSHNDASAVNARLADECSAQGAGLLIPFGTINPLLPDWQEDLRRVHEVHQMPGVRLHPNYHGYKLDAPEFAGLLAAVAERKLLVQIALRMEDPRTQHRLFTAPDVDASPLVELLPKFPQLRVQILNGLNALRPDLVDRLIAAGDLSVEIAMLEGVAGITNLLKHVPLERVLFGSYFPFFAWESAKLKLQESELTQRLLEAIQQTNAERLLSRAG
jgi:predicted TIM-barrel fold metal-dependent hydrolase